MPRPQLREDEVRTLAQIYGVPESLALAIWGQESSRGTNVRTSAKGPRGGFQVIPSTFQQYNPGGNIDDPVDNATAGLKYLRDLMDRYGDPELAAQAYYGGRPVGVRGKLDVTSGPGTPTISQYGRQVVQRMGQVPMLPMPTPYEPTQPNLDQLQFLVDNGSPAPDFMAANIPSLDEIAQSVPVPLPPRNPMMAAVADMYGATDRETGLPMDVLLGLRDPGSPNPRSPPFDSDTHNYLAGLVDSTLNGMNFG